MRPIIGKRFRRRQPDYKFTPVTDPDDQKLLLKIDRERLVIELVSRGKRILIDAATGRVIDRTTVL